MKKFSNRLEFTGERLIRDSKILIPLRRENIARFRFFTEHTDGSHILDLGCGTGEGTAYLGKQPNKQIIGVDLSFRALHTARQDYQQYISGFAQMDAQRLAFSDDSFDAMISVEVIEHVNDPMSYLKESQRVLKDNGLLMITTPNRIRSSPNRASLWPDHLREYSPNELYELLLHVYNQVELWGEHIPNFERHPIRKLFRIMAPIIKPFLPRYIRIRALPMLQTAILSNLQLEDVVFTKDNLNDLPTIVALCRK